MNLLYFIHLQSFLLLLLIHSPLLHHLLKLALIIRDDLRHILIPQDGLISNGIDYFRLRAGQKGTIYPALIVVANFPCSVARHDICIDFRP